MVEPPTHPDWHFRPLAAWGTISVLIFFTLLSYIDRQIVSLLVAPIKHDLALNDTEISLLQGLAFALCYSCAGIPIGIAADRYSRRLLLFMGIVFFSLSSAACSLARSFEALFVTRLLVGVGEAVLTPVALALISDNFPRHRLPTAMGVFGMAPYIGFGGAISVGGVVIGVLDALPDLSVPLLGQLRVWQATFLVTGLSGLPFAFLSFTLGDPRAASAGASSPLARARLAVALEGRGRVLAYFLAGFGLLAIVSYVTLGWTPSFMVRRHGWDPGRIGLWLGPIVTLTGITGSFLYGQFISRLIRENRPDAYFAVPAVSCLAAVPFFVGAYLVDNPWLTLGSMAIGYVLFSSCAPSSYTSIQLIVPRSARALASALYVFVAAICGAALGPLLVALVTDHVLMDERRLGESLAIVLGTVIPIGCVILLAGRNALRRALELPDEE